MSVAAISPACAPRADPRRRRTWSVQAAPVREAERAPAPIASPPPPAAPRPRSGPCLSRTRPAAAERRTPRQSARVFVSYRREDTAYISDRISERLTQRFGRDAVFKDVDSIPLGQDFRKHLKNAVSRCDVLLAVIGKDWLAIVSSHRDAAASTIRETSCESRFESALERDIPVIPVLVQGALVPTEDNLPDSAAVAGVSQRAARPAGSGLQPGPRAPDARHPVAPRGTREQSNLRSHAPLARHVSRRQEHRHRLPRHHRDSQGQQEQVRARQRDRSAETGPRALQLGALPRRLRLHPAHLLRRRRSARRARAQPGARVSRSPS